MTNPNQVRENSSSSAADPHSQNRGRDTIPQSHPAYPDPIPEGFDVTGWWASAPLIPLYEIQRKPALQTFSAAETEWLHGAWIAKRMTEGALDLGEDESDIVELHRYRECTDNLYASPVFQALDAAAQKEVREFLTLHRIGPRPFPPSVCPSLRRLSSGECFSIHAGRLAPVVGTVS